MKPGHETGHVWICSSCPVCEAKDGIHKLQTDKQTDRQTNRQTDRKKLEDV